MYRKLNLAVLAALALLVAACGSSDSDATTTTVPATTVAPATTSAPTTAAPATTTAAPTTTVAPTTTSAPTTTTAAPSTTTTAAPPTSSASALPAELAITHGGDAVGVYLGVIEDSVAVADRDAAFALKIELAAEIGYTVGIGTLGCDQGAAEALGFGPGTYWTAALYFATLEEANMVVQAYPDIVTGIAEVKTYCLD